MNYHDHLDEILDTALGEYRDAEPLAGMEDRVLRRLRLQPVDRRTTWWKWGAVAVCSAILAFAVWLGLREYRPQGPVARRQTEAGNVDIRPEAKLADQTPRTAANKPPPLPQRTIQAPATRSAGPRMQTARLGDTGRDFPNLVAPLTSEERQLLALAQTRPDVVRAIAQEDQPIAITPLTIQRLPSEANENGDN